MGAPGDLLLIFADALVRSWKQITKFRPAGTVAPPTPAAAFASEAATYGAGAPKAGEPAAPAFSLEGLIRDERGIRYAPEAED